MDNAVILSACRTPIGSFGGAFIEGVDPLVSDFRRRSAR